MKIINLLVCASLLCTALPLAAEIYKSVDEHGNVIYTDNPKGNEKVDPVDLPPVNTQPATPTYKRPPKQEAAQAVQYQVSINSPSEGTQIPMGQHEIPVSLSLQPNLRDGAYIQILLNGEAFGQEFYTTELTLREVYRGEHSLQAAIISASGEELARSDSVTIYVQRSNLSNRMPNPTPIPKNIR